MIVQRNSDAPRIPPSLDVTEIGKVTEISQTIDQRVGVVLAARFRPGERRECYVTFATPEYLLGAKVLARSLRRQTTRPIVILTDREWTFDTGVEDVHFVTVPRLVNSRHSPRRAELRITPTKLWIFGLLSLDRVAYIDADCLVVQPIDDLFDRHGFWASPDYVEDTGNQRFNAGLMVFEPSAALRDKVFREASAATSYDHGDQGTLNEILADQVSFLPPAYCVTRHYHHFHRADIDPNAVRVIHYIVKKPWELWHRELPDNALIDLDDQWTAQLTHEELLTLVSQWRRRQSTLQRSRLVWTSFRQVLSEAVRPIWIATAALGALIVLVAVALWG